MEDFFFFMWRRWQLPCIALSLNNGMLICITRDVITSTVKRKHNNSSSAPPWDRLGWPTLALWRDALELWLSQAHTRAHSYAHAHTHTDVHAHVYTNTHRVTQSCKLFGAQLCSSAHSVQRFSCWPAPLEQRYAHIKLCTRLLATQISSGHARFFFSKKPSFIKLLCCHISLIFTKALFYQNMATLLGPFFFTSVYYPSISHLPFWRWAADRVEKSCGWQLHCQYSAVSWEETKCISQCGGNVTVLVIRAFKLAALPKHCQTLCERGEILTVLSPLIVGA